MRALVFVTEFMSVCWIGSTKSAGFIVQGWVLVCWWCLGRSSLCGGGILGAVASVSGVVSTCPCDVVVQIFPSAFRAFLSVFCFFDLVKITGVGFDDLMLITTVDCAAVI